MRTESADAVALHVVLASGWWVPAFMRYETVHRLTAKQVGLELLQRYEEALVREARFERKRGARPPLQTDAPPERWLLINGELPELFESGDPTGVRGTWPVDPLELGLEVKAYVEQQT